MMCKYILHYFPFNFFKKNWEIFGLNNWINPPPHNQHMFLFSNFPNFVIVVGKKMKKIMHIQKKLQKTKTITQNLIS